MNQLVSAQNEIRCLKQTLGYRDREITSLQDQVASLEEQKMNLAWELESVKGTAQFFKRKIDRMQSQKPLASKNRPQEPSLLPEEKKKKVAPSLSSQHANPYVSASRSSRPASKAELDDPDLDGEDEKDDDEEEAPNILVKEEPDDDDDDDAEEQTKQLTAKPSQAPQAYSSRMASKVPVRRGSQSLESVYSFTSGLNGE